VAPGGIVGVLEFMVGFLGEIMWVPGEMRCFMETWGVLRDLDHGERHYKIDCITI